MTGTLIYMIDLGSKNHCICQKMTNSCRRCTNEYTLNDSGISIKLEPKSASEKVCLIVIDDCLINDRRKRCDGLFLYSNSRKNIQSSFLIELKGSHIEDAFEQLSLTKTYNEYTNIIEKFRSSNNYFAIASNTLVDKVEQQKLEKEFNIRVRVILYTTPTDPIPDLREYI